MIALIRFRFPFKHSIQLLLYFTLFFVQCSEDDPTPNANSGNGNVDPNDDSGKPAVLTEREKAIKDFEENYLASNASFKDWSGNKGECKAGTLPEEVYAKALQQINYYRRQVGLNDDISFDEAKNKKCQQAALMMLANGDLDHSPPKDWKCYTDDGAEAAGKSNLGRGQGSTNVITTYIRDSGNESLGHRRWILYSKAHEFGFGATTSSNALWVIGGEKSNDENDKLEFIPWPPAGYVIDDLVFATWSFSIPKANFSESQVSMKGSDGQVELTYYVAQKGYGDNTLAWVPQISKPAEGEDIKYEVTISKVKVDNEYQDYKYEVIVIGY